MKRQRLPDDGLPLKKRRMGGPLSTVITEWDVGGRMDTFVASVTGLIPPIRLSPDRDREYMLDVRLDFGDSDSGVWTLHLTDVDKCLMVTAFSRTDGETMTIGSASALPVRMSPCLFEDGKGHDSQSPEPGGA